MIFIAQIIGGLAISIWVVSIQIKDRKNILKLQSLANLLYSIEYFLLGAFSASLMNILSTIRCFLFSKIDNNSYKLSIMFIILIISTYIFTYDEILSLIPIIITIFYTISSSSINAKWNRLTVLIAAFIWIYYNYKVGAYITILGNVLEIVSGTLSLIRFKNK